MNLSKSYQIGLLTIVYIFLFSACKKKDTVLPQISVTSPGTNTQYYVLQDYIPCIGTVSDDVELDYIEMELVDGSGIPVMGKKPIQPDSNPYDFSSSYPLDDIHIESGNYKMKITVYDKAGNYRSKFIDVIIFGVPRAKRGVFYTAETGGNYYLGKIDSLDQDSSYLYSYNDYGGMEINNYDQQLFYMGYDSEDLMAINSNSYQVDWTLNNQANPPGTYYFHQLHFTADRYLLINLYQDEILKRTYYNAGAGNVELNYTNAQAESVLKDGNYLYTESVHIGTGNRRFQRYFFNSGGFNEEYAIDYDFKKIFNKNADELLIFGESGGNGVMKIFYKNGGNYFQPVSLNAESFVDAFQIDSNNYIVVQGQSVSKYGYQTSNFYTIINEPNILSADYDDLNDQIYLGFANMVKVYTGNGQFVRNIPVSGNVINLKVHYNK